MVLKLKEGAETEGLPTINLAGLPYHVGSLRLRERIAVAALAPRVKAIVAKLPSAEEMKQGATATMSEDDYLILVDVIRHGLVKLYPAVTRDSLLDEQIDLNELFAAYPVIVAQGTSRRASTGEAQATSPTPSSGEGSSPI